MRALLIVALCCLAFYVAAEYDEPAGSPVGFSFSAIVDGFSGMNSAVTAFPFVSSAGFSKLLVVGSSNGQLYVIDDLAQAAPTSTKQVSSAMDIAGLAGNIYLTVATGGVVLLDAAATTLASYNLVLETVSLGEDILCPATGIVVNPTNKHLYIACAAAGDLNTVIIDVDPDIFVGAASGSSFSLPNGDFSILVDGNPASLNFAGLAFSSTYSTLYAVGSDASSTQVFGYSIQQGANKGLVFWSSPLPGFGVGVIAGTGCLAGFLYVSHGRGLSQIDLNGVQTPVLVDSNMNIGSGGYLHNDPLDGSLLVPAFDPAGGDLLRVVGPQCGGFAGPFRFFAPGEPIGSTCSIDAECSTKNCVLGTPNTCQSGGYHGACQTNADCVGPDTDGYWCQLFRHRVNDDDDDDKHKKRKHNDDDDGKNFKPAPWADLDENFFPARYGVCNINSCSVNHGGCDVNADCIHTGDAQRICKCKEGWYGSGAAGTCVNPCLLMPNPCDTNAACSSTSLTNIICKCNSPTYFGAGTPGTCVLNPCQTGSNNCAAQVSDAQQFCSPVTAGTFTCTCGAGFWKPPGTNDPQCIPNPCSNPNACDPHASCTPLNGNPTYQCTCNDGYSPATMVPNPICNPSICAPLTPPMFGSVFEPFGVVGTCVGLVTGQTCQVGCADGYSARGQTFTTCTGAQGSTASYYSVPLFECIQDATNGGHKGHRHGDDDDGFNTPDVEEPISAWNCPKNGRCRPGTPFVTRDQIAKTATLHWLPLGQPDFTGALTELRVSIQPAFGSVTYSPPITNPWYADGVTINNLQSGVTYKFRLVATVSGQYVASDAVTA